MTKGTRIRIRKQMRKACAATFRASDLWVAVICLVSKF